MNFERDTIQPIMFMKTSFLTEGPKGVSRGEKRTDGHHSMLVAACADTALAQMHGSPHASVPLFLRSLAPPRRPHDAHARTRTLSTQQGLD